MRSRKERRERAQANADQRAIAARRVDTARTEIAHRSLLAAADPYRDELPDFYATARLLGVVPDPAPVRVEALTAETRLLPLLGLLDKTNPTSEI